MVIRGVAWAKDAAQLLVGFGVPTITEFERGPGDLRQAVHARRAHRQRPPVGLGGELRYRRPVSPQRRELRLGGLSSDLPFGTLDLRCQPPGLLGRGPGHGEVAYPKRYPRLDSQDLPEQAQTPLLAQPLRGGGQQRRRPIVRPGETHRHALAEERRGVRWHFGVADVAQTGSWQLARCWAGGFPA